MGFIKKLIIAALIVAAVYFVYKEIFEPMIRSGQKRLGNFYGNVPIPKIE